MYWVTGADGFIGSHLCEKITNFIKLDENFRPCEYSGQKPEAVFHLGAISATTTTDTRDLAWYNILSSCKMLEWCVENRVPFVYASSASVYGLGDNGFTEDAMVTPMNYYAISKASFDMFALQKINDNPDAKIFGLRYFNVYGTNEHHKGDMASPIYKFTKQANDTGEIKVFEGSEKYIRDFISVEDVVDITLAAKEFKNSGIYNVGTGSPRSFLDVANIISAHTNAQVVEIPFPEHLKGKYQAFTKSNNLKLLNAYDHVFLTLEQGIEKCINK